MWLTNSLNSKILKILICGCLIWLSANLGKPQTVLSQAQRPPISLNNVSRVTEVARFGRGKVSDFSWTPDGQLRVSTSAGLWQYSKEQIKTDQPTPLLQDYSGEIVAVAGNSVFLRQRDRSLTLYDLQTRQERRILRASDENMLVVAVSLDGTRLAFVRWSAFLPAGTNSRDDFVIHILDIQSGREVQTVKAGSAPRFQISPDGRLIATTNGDSSNILLWDIQTGKQLQTFYTANTWSDSLVFSNDNTMIAAGTGNEAIQLFDTRNAKLIHTFPSQTKYSAVIIVVSPDGQLIASGNWRENIIAVWKIATGEIVATLQGHQDGILALSFSPDGTSLVSNSYDETIRIWDAKTWSVTAVLSNFTRSIGTIAFNPSNSQLIFASYKVIRKWNPVANLVLKAVPDNPISINDLAVTPDGKTLFMSSFDGLQEWETASLSLSSKFGEQENRALAINPNGMLLASGYYREIKLWDISKKTVLHTLSGHEDTINEVAFSPDGTVLASVSGAIQGDVVYKPDNTLRLWNVQTGKQIIALQGADYLHSLAFSPDSKLIATGATDGVIQLWDVASKLEVARFSANDDRVSSLVFSNDNTLLFAGGFDTLIHVWDVKAKTEVKTLKGHLDWINDLVLSKDGTQLASASEDGTVRVWAVN